jgi:HAD superfamily hydrolase (TIGR01509 family)
VVFDMDGLLIDTEAAAREAFHAISDEQGLGVPPEVYAKLIGLHRIGGEAVLREHFGPGFDVAALFRTWDERFFAMAKAGIALKHGVIELLDTLDELKLPRAIATSSGHQGVQRNLGPHGLLGRFDAVLAQGDYERSKPYPDPFLAAARILGIDPADCLGVEDSHNGVRAAHAAGMMTIMAPDLLDPTEEILGLGVRVVASLHEVRDLVIEAWC